LSIETGDLKIATDPWFKGPAYCGQWNIFPKPVSTASLSNAQLILYSHGHEDHFHVPSLLELPRTARVLYPYTWYGGIKPYLSELGFPHAEEAPTHKTIQVSPKTAVTYIVNNLDSIVVIESEGRVFVNVNDALHSYPARIVEVFLRYIRSRWPRIDVVFSGFGGASFFPNCVHCEGKNDVEIAEAREQMFVHAFCRIVHDLKPRVAVPFAADFVLLHPNQHWINKARFPRSRMSEYYREIYGEQVGAPRIEVMYPGDILAGDELLPLSPYRNQLCSGGLLHLMDEQYRDEIAALQQPRWIGEEEVLSLEKELLHNLRMRQQFFDPKVLNKIEFSLRLTDVAERPYLNVSLKSGEPRIERSSARSQNAILQIEIRSDILRYSFASDWGGDAITIGYGCEVHAFDQATIDEALDSTCVQLLTRIPFASRHWRREPIRMAQYVLSSPINRGWAKQAALNRFGHRKAASSDNNDRLREWLFRTKCEVCKACDLPMLDERFAEAVSSN
jgi:hypothetical protein